MSVRLLVLPLLAGGCLDSGPPGVTEQDAGGADGPVLEGDSPADPDDGPAARPVCTAGACRTAAPCDDDRWRRSSRIQSARLDPGTYVIIATGATRTDFGRFTLSAFLSPPD